MGAGNNPFTPLFGQIPLHMAGRDELIMEMKEAFLDDGLNPNLASIIVGTRGTGKTALLTLLANEAGEAGWIAVCATSLPGMLENVYEQALKRSAHLISNSDDDKVPRITGVTLGGFGLEWNNGQSGGPISGTWRTRMEKLLDELKGQETGLLICVDEVDPDLAEMAELAACFQHFVQEGYRVSLVMAGLPSRVLSLLTGKSTSFLRRASQHRLGRIADCEIERAFESTVADGGKAIEVDALEEAVRAIEGFPFMMQMLGYHCWRIAGKDETLSRDVVLRGIRSARRELRERVYDTMYYELSQGDRNFLAAMLEDKGSSALTDLRKRLGKTSQQLSYQKKRLIGQGIIRDEMRGFVAFDMPGIREYLADQFEL